jgi:hypothetical protein
MELSGQLHSPAAFPSRERAPDTHWIGGWVDHRANLYDLDNREFLTLPGLELQILSHPARSQSLYRLRYPKVTNQNLFQEEIKNREFG